MNILLVEDNRDLATNLRNYFEACDHKIDLAEDGVPGLHSASTNQYDVIILDVMLPSMDGLTMCKQLRESGKHPPILMLTALDSLNDRISCLEACADDCVVKSITLREVETRVHALIRRANM